MRHRSRMTLLCLLALVFALGVAACAGAQDSAPPGLSPEPSGQSPADGTSASFASTSLSAMVTDGMAQGQVDRLIVRTAALRVEVAEVPGAVSGVEAVAEELGGYVQSSDVRGLPEEPQATVRVRVPADRYQEARQRIRELADTVLSEETSSDDVTEEYVDLSARLRNQQDVEQQLTALLERADSVNDVLSVQREVANTREEVERLQGRIEFLEQSAAESTITVRMSQVGSGVRVAAAWAPENTWQNATSALLSVLRGAGNALIVAGVFSPIWIPVGLGGLWLYRRQSKQAAPGVGESEA